MQPLREWREASHVPHQRRASPNAIYASGQDLINATLTRIELLSASAPADVSDMPLLSIQNNFGMDFTPKSYKSPMDAFDEYEIVLGPPMESELFVARNGTLPLLLNFPSQTEGEVSLAGVIEAGPDHLEMVFVGTDASRMINKIAVYREQFPLKSVLTTFREIDQAALYAEDAVRFIDGSTVSVDDLVWHYASTHAQVVRESLLWSGVMFPVRVLAQDGHFVDSMERNVDLDTYIMRPHVSMTLAFKEPVYVDEEFVLLAETKYSLMSVVCRVPRNGVSIGMPVVGDYSGLLVRMHVSEGVLRKIDALAYDYPFRTSLLDATPALPSPNADLSFLFSDELESADLANSFARDDFKDWLEGDIEEYPPLISDSLQPTEPHGWPLSRFVLHYGPHSSSPATAEYDGYSTMTLRDPLPAGVLLPGKKKARMHVSYVLDHAPHKHRLKFRPSNNTETRSHFFELPGPLHLRLVLEPVAEGTTHALKAVVVDTLRTLAPPPSPVTQTLSRSSSSSSLGFSSSEDEDWRKYL